MRDDKVAMLIGVEGGHALGTADERVAIERLRELHRLGARYMTMTWTNDNPLGHASSGAHPELGLTDLGRTVVREMNRLGMIADVSHVSDRTLVDVLEVSTRPVLASHSSARALADHPRNVTDEMIRQIAAGGGAVCVNHFSQFLDSDYARRRRRVERNHRDRFRALDEENEHWYERAPLAFALAQELDPALDPPDVTTLADHIEHVLRVGGPGAACLGSDFDGVQDQPIGLEDASKLGNLRAELERRGVDVRAVFHGNTLRVLDGQTSPSAPRH
jgi:membrane dipeptidase